MADTSLHKGSLDNEVKIIMDRWSEGTLCNWCVQLHDPYLIGAMRCLRELNYSIATAGTETYEGLQTGQAIIVTPSKKSPKNKCTPVHVRIPDIGEFWRGFNLVIPLPLAQKLHTPFHSLCTCSMTCAHQFPKFNFAKIKIQ